MSLSIKDISNLQERPNGIVTFTIDSSWMGSAFSHGWGNGYLGFPEGHFLFWKDYSAVEGIEVHGGLTYSNVAEINGKKYWVLGFDTNHYRDDEYNCNEQYVLSEIESLYRQIIELVWGQK